MDPLSASEIDALVEALGRAPQVSYAPPNIYPMSAPVFDAASGADRGAQPDGPIGVYAHIPYCKYKCTFCFYATQPMLAVDRMTAYVEALERELRWLHPETPLTQLYVGGGTPTALPAELLDRVLAAIFARVIPGDAVNTVECSPDSITEAHVSVLKRHGIERVSMGVQSTEEGIREHLNRQHGNRDVILACGLLVEAGLVVNADLIYGLPGQSHESFRRDFEMVADQGVHSVTCYNLRINEKTPIGRKIGDDARFDVAALVRWRSLAARVAHDCGFEQTRWHTFQRVAPTTAADALARFRDVTGWDNQFGVGVSARSRLDYTVYRNQSKYPAYLERIQGGRSPVEEVKALDEGERRLRFVTLTLGDGQALDRSAYERIHGVPFDEDFGKPLRHLVDAGVVTDDGHQVTLTNRGRLVYDLAMRAFYPESVRRWMEERDKLAETSVNLRPRTQ